MHGIGLDLGSSNSVAAAVRDGRPATVPLRGGTESIPSVVALDAHGRWLVGRDARAQLLQRPRETVTSMKTLLGRTVRSTAFRKLAEGLSYRVGEGPDGACAIVAETPLSLVDAASMVLEAVRGQAQDNLGYEVTEAVLPVPDYFVDEQREAIAEAARRASMPRVRVIDESEALVSLVSLAGRGREDRRVFLYGLGGGVFDATVLERTPGGDYEVVASTGEELGGAQFDRRVGTHLHGFFLQQHGLGAYSDPVGLQRVLEAAEACKIRMDTEDEVPVSVPFLELGSGGTPLDLVARMDRRTFVELTGDLVRQTLAISASVLRAAQVEPAEIDAVYLYGRAARAREVQAATCRFFGRRPVRLPENAAALGAAILAA